MENLEEVVRERNRAYFELETGGSGERERVIRQGMESIQVFPKRGGRFAPSPPPILSIW